jgi:DNA-binding protein YbaB
MTQMPADELFSELIAAVSETNEQVRRAQQIREQAGRISVHHRSADGAVEVTVDANGVLTDLAFTETVRRIPHQHLGRVVLTCLHEARSRVGPQYEQIVRLSGADEGAIARMVGRYRESHPERFGAEPKPAARAPEDDDFGEGLQIMRTRGARRG